MATAAQRIAARTAEKAAIVRSAEKVVPVAKGDRLTTPESGEPRNFKGGAPVLGLAGTSPLTLFPLLAASFVSVVLTVIVVVMLVAFLIQRKNEVTRREGKDPGLPE